MGLEFEWDPVKAEKNLGKHGVSFAEATTVFGDPFSTTVYDPEHSQGEVRFLILGMSHRGRLLVVAHTDRDGRIRVISARRAGRQEERRYEQAP